LTRDFAFDEPATIIVYLYLIKHPSRTFIEFDPEAITNTILEDLNIRPMYIQPHTINMQSYLSHRRIITEVMIDT